MKNLLIAVIGSVIMLAFTACGNSNSSQVKNDSTTNDIVATYIDTVSLPEPYATKSTMNFSKVIGWPLDKTPVAPKGFKVEKYAVDLINPRMIYVMPNGDIAVAESNTELKGAKKLAADVSGKAKSQRLGESANRITLFSDLNNDGMPDRRTIFLQNLNQPFGMLVIDNYFYVANTDGLWRFPYKKGDSVLKSTGEKIVNLPAGGYNNHWTRNIIANHDNSKIYISVGSASNVAEHGMENEQRRANILEVNPDGSGERIYASGLRNPVGMDWAVGSKTLWTAVNERDELGDELVPDYITSVQENGFYGWPYSYYGNHADPRLKGKHPEMSAKAIVPDMSVGNHTASLGLCFYDGEKFPVLYQNGAFIGQHGSWNKSTLAGYKVAFVPFKNGKPSGKIQDFLTGFIANESNEVYGRPVGLAVSPDGALLVADDSGNTIWKVSTSN